MVTAGLFPGQGIAATDILDALAPGDPLIARAKKVAGFDLVQRVRAAARHSEGKLPTSLAQPAIFLAGISSWMRTRDEVGDISFLAGHSLGEYTALVAGKSISFEHALKAVIVRGEAMQVASRLAPGGMAAILGLDYVHVSEIAQRAGAEIANDNAPGQVVVSGTEAALARTAELAKAAGGRSVLLDVAGAFHTAAMAAAVDDLIDALDHIEIRSPEIPVISNVTARPYRAPGEIRKLLRVQVTETVRWRESIEWMWQQGAREWHDFGPGRVVGALATKTVRSLTREEDKASA